MPCDDSTIEWNGGTASILSVSCIYRVHVKSVNLNTGAVLVTFDEGVPEVFDGIDITDGAAAIVVCSHGYEHLDVMAVQKDPNLLLNSFGVFLAFPEEIDPPRMVIFAREGTTRYPGGIIAPYLVFRPTKTTEGIKYGWVPPFIGAPVPVDEELNLDYDKACAQINGGIGTETEYYPNTIWNSHIYVIKAELATSKYIIVRDYQIPEMGVYGPYTDGSQGYGPSRIRIQYPGFSIHAKINIGYYGYLDSREYAEFTSHPPSHMGVKRYIDRLIPTMPVPPPQTNEFGTTEYPPSWTYSFLRDIAFDFSDNSYKWVMSGAVSGANYNSPPSECSISIEANSTTLALTATNSGYSDIGFTPTVDIPELETTCLPVDRTTTPGCTLSGCVRCTRPYSSGATYADPAILIKHNVYQLELRNIVFEHAENSILFQEPSRAPDGYNPFAYWLDSCNNQIEQRNLNDFSGWTQNDWSYTAALYCGETKICDVKNIITHAPWDGIETNVTVYGIGGHPNPVRSEEIDFVAIIRSDITRGILCYARIYGAFDWEVDTDNLLETTVALTLDINIFEQGNIRTVMSREITIVRNPANLYDPSWNEYYFENAEYLGAINTNFGGLWSEIVGYISTSALNYPPNYFLFTNYPTTLRPQIIASLDGSMTYIMLPYPSIDTEEEHYGEFWEELKIDGTAVDIAQLKAAIGDTNIDRLLYAE